ncbi:hypothetical protein QWZ13_13040 [Reinekea marina]|nr:hypothetical protein [Reinekea marina]MDN3649839.1 hypothetical protein [Reinekea marina]
MFKSSTIQNFLLIFSKLARFFVDTKFQDCIIRATQGELAESGRMHLT